LPVGTSRIKAGLLNDDQVMVRPAPAGKSGKR